eukprot:7195908-Pyramimonas_sp.AAC.1
MRKLGRDRRGGRVSRTQIVHRLKRLAVRRGRLMSFKRTVGKMVGCPWKTELLPSAAHGAGVSGLTEEVLAKLRSTAGLLVGARSGSSSLTRVAASFSRNIGGGRGAVFIWSNCRRGQRCSWNAMRNEREPGSDA